MARALPLLALMLAAPANSQFFAGDDSNAPVNFDAQQGVFESRADRAVLSGGVRITQGRMRLNADRVTVIFSPNQTPGSLAPEINRVDAIGNVVFTRGDDIARGKMGIYDIERRIITLVGDVSLTQGTNRLAGERLVIDMQSGGAILDGTPAGKVVDRPGRVTATFHVQGKKP